MAGIGFFWKKFGYEYRIEFVTQLVMSLTLPCLIFNALIQTQIDFEILKTLLYATLTVLALIVAATYVIVVILGLKRQTFLAPMIFGNSANIGIPICLLAFGQTGFELAIFIFSIMAIFSALMVIASRNTVNSVFFLILDFISVGCLTHSVKSTDLSMVSI